MIEAIYDAGVHILHEKNVNLDKSESVIGLLCEDPKSSDLYKTIITVEVEKTGTQTSFTHVGMEEYSNEKISKYLYRRGSSNGPDLSPTCRLTEPQKTVKGKFFKWFDEDFSNSLYKLTQDEQNIINSIKECVLANKQKITEGIISKYNTLKANKESGIITITVYSNGEKKYLGEIDAFKKILQARALTNYFEKYNKTSKADNQTCSVCRKKDREVYGFVSTYAFYTVDKPGMVSGGFDQSKAWRNYPVCKNCALTLEEGKRFIEKNGSFRFYGFDYFLIPQPLNFEEDSDIYEILKEYHHEGTKVKLTKEYRKLIDETEEEILDYVSEKPNIFQFNIMIYAASNSEFKILRYIQGVFPSRLRELFNVKAFVDKNDYFKEFTVKVYEKGKQTGEKPLEFNFGSFWYFFGKQKDEDKSAYFIDIISKVFQGQKISYPFFLNGIVSRIRKQFAQGYNTKEASMRGLCSLLYLHKLGLLSDYDKGDDLNQNKLCEVLRDPQYESSTQKLVAIFDSFPDFFDKNSKRAVFTVGVLAQLLLNIQYQERKATPFRTKLQGLRLDQRRVIALLPEIQNKLEEYKKNYYRDLQKFASEYLIQAGNNWKLSKDDVSFYFVLGMNLASYLKQSKEVKNDE